MTNNKILFILSAEPNVATATAKHFAAQGYQVALVSRGISTSFDPSYFYIQGDLSNSEKIPEWFAQVRKKNIQSLSPVFPPNLLCTQPARANLNS